MLAADGHARLHSARRLRAAVPPSVALGPPQGEAPPAVPPHRPPSPPRPDSLPLPGLADTAPSTTGLPADALTLLHALAVLHTPVTANRLASLLDGARLRTQRGTHFHSAETRRLLDELLEQGLVLSEAQGLWHVPHDAVWPILVRLASDPTSRSQWWQFWRQMHHFEMAWRLDLPYPTDVVAAVRAVVLLSGRRDDFDRLCRLATDPSPRHPVLLARALLAPFDSATWDTLDPELRWPLLEGLLDLARGDQEQGSRPLWQWLRAQAAPDAHPGVDGLHDATRIALAEHLLFCAQPEEAERVVQGLDTGLADAVRAGALVQRGQYAAGATAYEAALKRRAAETGKRKLLLTTALGWIYLLALLARSSPAEWTAARKFVAAEAGRRDADPYTFWGIWQAALDQRLGDAPRSVGVFRLAPAKVQLQRLPGLQQLAHLLLAAWLGHSAPDPQGLAELGDQLAADYQANGQQWLATLAKRAAAQVLGLPCDGPEAQAPFPIGAAQDRWRDALNAIVALGTAAGGAAGEPVDKSGNRLVWSVKADALGRLRGIEVMEQKAGPRGLGKPKAAALSTLAKRNDLPAHDAAVLRAVKKSPFGARWSIDRQQAVLALVRHPHVVWHDRPEQFIEISEGLPRLEVLTQGEHLQFKVVDKIRPEDLRWDDLADTELDAEEVFERLRQQRDGPGSGQAVLLLREDDSHARLVRISPAQLRVAELVRQGWQVPVSARAELDEALRVLGTHFQLASDADAGHEVPASPVLRAELTPQREGLALALRAAPFGDFGPRLPPGQGRPRVTTVHQGLTLSTRRDLGAEAAQRQALLEALPGLDDGASDWAFDEPDQALAVVEALARLSPGVVSEWPKGKGLRVRPVSAAQVQLRVKSSGQGQWLALDGEVQVDGGEVLRLEKLLALMGDGRRRFLALGEGEFLALSDSLRQQLADLRALAQPHGAGQRLSPVAALAWSQQAGAPALQGDGPWQKRCAAWGAAQAHTPTLPTGLQAELRDYQLAGWQWLMRLAASGFGAVLADDMGLGKTLQTLALLAARASGGPALVVAPTSVCGNWLAEAARFTPGLRVAQYGDGGAGEPMDDSEADDSGDATADTDPDANTPEPSARLAPRRRQVQALGPGDVLLCSYGLLQRDAEVLGARLWHTVVLDEAQAIKNAATRRAKAAQALDGDFRLALTGTPVENRLAELWAIMAFANPGVLGSAETFQQRFATPIERDGDAEARRRLRRLVAPFVLRRTKAEVLADLPPRTEIVLSIAPGSRERALLEALRRQAEAEVTEALGSASGPGTGPAQMHLLAALTRLRRAACDPRLVAPELGLVGAKVQAFEQLALELAAGRHKALVFSQFTDFLALLRERLDAAGLSYQYLDGSTPAAQRTHRVNAFQAGEGDFFLISLKAGGFGLNLTMADYVIIADPWWNPAAEDQASGRAHRIGQTRPVTVYRLVTQGSIEDRIVQLHQHKRALADGVLAAEEGAAAVPLDSAALLALLRDEIGMPGT